MLRPIPTNPLLRVTRNRHMFRCNFGIVSATQTNDDGSTIVPAPPQSRSIKSALPFSSCSRYCKHSKRWSSSGWRLQVVRYPFDVKPRFRLQKKTPPGAVMNHLAQKKRHADHASGLAASPGPRIVHNCDNKQRTEAK